MMLAPKPTLLRHACPIPRHFRVPAAAGSVFGRGSRHFGGAFFHQLVNPRARRNLAMGGLVYYYVNDIQ